MSGTLTACVITLDEEERLPACLASLAFCDEVVVVDSGSTDRTREIAREAGARVIENPWRGFGAQRNVALDHATGEWVLEIDADERIEPELAASIAGFLAAAPAEARLADLPMRELFLGRLLGPSIRYPRYRLRLFRRGAYRHDEARTVHEGLWPDGPVVPLEGDMVHLLAGSLGEALRDAVAYARLDAGQRSRPDTREAILGIAVRPLAKLLYRLFLYGGWRDGWQGWLRIALECGGDSLATVYRLGPRGGGRLASAGLGQAPPRLGSVRIVGVALRGRGIAKLEAWLGAAAAAGADVSLIGPGPATDSRVRRRALTAATPGAVARALDAEEQVRTIDALVCSGRAAATLVRAAPGALRGVAAPLDPAADPAAAVRALVASTRGQETG